MSKCNSNYYNLYHVCYQEVSGRHRHRGCGNDYYGCGDGYVGGAVSPGRPCPCYGHRPVPPIFPPVTPPVFPPVPPIFPPVVPGPPTLSITYPLNGSTIASPTQIAGTAAPRASLSIYVDGVLTAQTTADCNGYWAVANLTALTPGTHTVRVIMCDRCGYPSEATSIFTVTGGTVTPPVITVPAAGSTITDATPTISGTGTPGNTVHVCVDAANCQDVVVAANGTWSYTVATALANGPHTITAYEMDGAGNMSSTVTSTFTVNAGGGTVPDPVITTPANGATVTTTLPTISGTGVAGNTVNVCVDGANCQNLTVDATGAWTYTPTVPLANGSHTITAYQMDGTGMSTTVSSSFTVAAAGSATPTVDAIAAGATTITGTGNAVGCEITVTYPDGTTTSTAPVVAGLTWTTTVPGTVTLATGETVTVTQTCPGLAPSTAVPETVA